MKPSTHLRIASIGTLLCAAGHSIGAPWTPATGPLESTLLESMKTLRFVVMGANRTYWDFYFGFGLSISIYLIAQAAVLWQLAMLAKTEASRYRSLMVTLLLSSLANGVVAWKYFFAAPLVLFAVVSLFIVLALVSAKPTPLAPN